MRDLNYQILMKVLDIIQQDELNSDIVTKERVPHYTNLTQYFELNQPEFVMEKYNIENVSQSIIAIKSSIERGTIAVRIQHGDEIADAVGDLKAVLTGELGGQLSEERRKDAMEHLEEIVKQCAMPTPSKSVLRSIGISLWGMIEKVEPLSKACLAAWKIVEKLWM